MNEKSPPYVPSEQTDLSNDQAYGGQLQYMRCGPVAWVEAYTGTDPALIIGSALEAARRGLPVGAWTNGTLPEEVWVPASKDEQGVQHSHGPRPVTVADLIAKCGGLAAGRSRPRGGRHQRHQADS